jgi:hypothetical protein
MGTERRHGSTTDAPRALQALRASGVALLAGCAAGAMIVLSQGARVAEPQHGLWSVLLAVGLLAHWAGVGIAARRLDRPVLGWVGLAVCLTPLGGAAALSLLGLMSAAELADSVGAPMGHAPAVSSA